MSHWVLGSTDTATVAITITRERGKFWYLPEKELRYLRTVIVTADIDEGLGPKANHQQSTINSRQKPKVES